MAIKKKENWETDGRPGWFFFIRGGQMLRHLGETFFLFISADVFLKGGEKLNRKRDGGGCLISAAAADGR